MIDPQILQSLRKDKWSPGQPIIAQGAIGNHFFVIASGVVSVLKDSVELKKLSIGDYFGEMGMRSTVIFLPSRPARHFVMCISLFRRMLH